MAEALAPLAVVTDVTVLVSVIELDLLTTSTSTVDVGGVSVPPAGVPLAVAVLDRRLAALAGPARSIENAAAKPAALVHADIGRVSCLDPVMPVSLVFVSMVPIPA